MGGEGRRREREREREGVAGVLVGSLAAMISKGEPWRTLANSNSGELGRTPANSGERRRTPANPAAPMANPWRTLAGGIRGYEKRRFEQEVCVAPKHPSTHQSSPEGDGWWESGIALNWGSGWKHTSTLSIREQKRNPSTVFFFSELAVPACYVCRPLVCSSELSMASHDDPKRSSTVRHEEGG